MNRGTQAWDIAGSARLGDGGIFTYRCAFTVATGGGGASDFVQIRNSSSLIVSRIKRVKTTRWATAAGGHTINLIKRSAIDTGGGPFTSQTVGPIDSVDVAATLVVESCINAPGALGAIAETVGNELVAFPAVNTGPLQITVWEFGGPGRKAVHLRGLAEALCLNHGGTNTAGTVCSVEVEWTEATV